MQPDADSILAASSQRLTISSDARTFLCRHRPELRAEFETLGEKGSIHVASLLQPASNPPLEQLVANVQAHVLGPDNAARKVLKSEPFRLGDFLAALLRRLRIEALVVVLMRRGLVRECHCAARQARLNALSERLGLLIHPLPFTLAVLLVWLLLIVMVLIR